MAGKATYNPISGFWVVVVPAVVGGATYYAYNTSGYVSVRIRAIIDPVMGPVVKLVSDFLPY